MKEDHHEIQTPKKEMLPSSSNRKAKSFNSQSKKLNHLPQKIVKKSLSSDFTPITLSENESDKISPFSASTKHDQSIVEISKLSLNSDHTQVSDNAVRIQNPEVSAGMSSVSDAFVSDEDEFSESKEISIVSLNQFMSPSSVKSGSVDMSPLSSTTTVEMTPSPSSSTITTEASAVFVTSNGATTEKMTSFETESLIKLRESMFQVLHSADIKPMYKKLLDELANTEYEERFMISDLFSKKETILLLSFVLGIIAVLARFFLFTDVQSSYFGPPPT